MKIKFAHEGQTFEAEAQNLRGDLWVHFQGRTFIHQTEAQTRNAKKSAGKLSKGEVVSPMPGKITKILKPVGAEVQMGDAILVMEAMKMEYTLKSDRPGIVKSIHCKVGDLVPLGKKLAHVDEEKV